jgi:hypothetical protein
MGHTLLTQKELAYRWSCTVRTVQNVRRQFGLSPVDCHGNQPLFNLRDILAAEDRRRRHRLQQLRRMKTR